MAQNALAAEAVFKEDSEGRPTVVTRNQDGPDSWTCNNLRILSSSRAPREQCTVQDTLFCGTDDLSEATPPVSIFSAPQ